MSSFAWLVATALRTVLLAITTRRYTRAAAGRTRKDVPKTANASAGLDLDPWALADRQLLLDRDRTKRFPDLFVRKLGADVAIDGKAGGIAEALSKFAPEGLDAVLGLVGGKTLTACIDALARGGRLAYPNGIEPTPRKRRGIKIGRAHV